MPSMTSDPNERSTSADNGTRPQTTPTHFVRARQHIHDIIYEPKPALLQLLSWVLTLQIFAISTIWYITTLPIRITLYVYEYWIRALCPKLPSVLKFLLSLRSALHSALPNPRPEPAGPAATPSGDPNRL